ncbi:MAG: 4-hydroxy-3-methylbut-2-enyl diphosphate reductase [Candidatus Midichloriaceae bacterium]|jgi:4-hydroxy-3-methylbut-2-enyl diphosphate reductase
MINSSSQNEFLEIYLANPRGFCAGVERAVSIVELALQKHGAPVYVKHEIVHNKYVVEDLKKKGAIFVEDIEDVPINAITIFSAHGVSKKVENDSSLKQLHIIDATCPLVKKVHIQAKNFENDGYKVILIGHKNHPEIDGTKGRLNQTVFIVEKEEDIDKIPYTKDTKIAYVTQTTLSVDDTKLIIKKLKDKYEHIKGPDTKNICFATQNRQDAVKKLSAISDVVFVIGSKNSSNSNRLKDISTIQCPNTYLFDDESEIPLDSLLSATKLGITAGASAPEILITNIINEIKKYRKIKIKNLDGIIEKVKFNIPTELR